MAKQIIGLGNSADDGTGSSLRAGGDIINDNFTEIYAEIGDGTDLGLSSKTITFSNKTINSASNTITITESNISDLGSYLENIVEDTSPQLGGDLDLNSNNITGTGNIPAANLTGALPAIDGSSLTGVSPIVASTLPTSNFGNGYVKFNGGYTIQWGKRTGTGNTTITQSFPVTFTYVYSIVITGAEASNPSNPGEPADGYIIDDNNTSTSQFKFHPTGGLESLYWIATGFISWNMHT